MAPLSDSNRNSRRKSLSGGYLKFGGTLSPARPFGHFLDIMSLEVAAVLNEDVLIRSVDPSAFSRIRGSER
jgi:hypothetical protein